MTMIPGCQFNVQGASGSQGLLAPSVGWLTYILPRGAFAAQDSSGTLITFDGASVAQMFAANDWIQVGTATANIRKVSAVGGNSLSVQGSAVTVTEGDRIFCIGSTQPTTSGGSTTYLVPRTTIRTRGDDSADRITNSMVTTDSNGLVRFYSEPAVYDAIIQDANRSPQGYIADLQVGVAEGVSTSWAAVFGATITVNASAIFGGTATFNQAIGVTGWATFGATVTINAALGVTGTAAFGGTLTAHAAFGVTGLAAFGNSIIVNGAISGTSVLLSNNVTCNRLIVNAGTTMSTSDFILSSGWGATASVNSVSTHARDTSGFVEVLAGGAGITDNPTVLINMKNGVWPGTVAHSFVNRMDRQAPTTAWWRPRSTVGNTQALFEFVGLPVSGSLYTFAWLIIG